MWRDLESKGFLVIRSYLENPEMALFMRDYSAGKLHPTRNYAAKAVSSECLDRIRPKIVRTAAQIHAETSVQVDTVESGIYFATAIMETGFDWHQDHESYYLYQDHHCYLNFYIPIQKSQKATANLSLIPFDVLEKTLPDIAGSRKGKGASRLICKGKKTFLIDDDAGKITEIARRLDDLAVTPELNAGDLLLLRGDVYHKTQSLDGDRVSVSLRVLNGQREIDRREFFRSCPAKQIVMSKNPESFALLDRYFSESRADGISIADFLRLRAGGACSPI